DGRQRLKNRELAEAVRTLTRGLSLAEDTSGNRDLRRDLEGQLRLAKRAQAADDLHNLVDRIRFLYGAESPAAGSRALGTRCRAVWEERQRILDLFGVELEPAIEQRIRTDLLDLALLWADLRVRRAPRKEAESARREALQVLAEAEALLGPSPLLFRQRQ